MKVTVQYLGQVRAVLNKGREEVDVSPKTTVFTLLKQLTERYGEAFEGEVFEEEGKAVREGLIVTVNGKAIGQLQGTKTRLNVKDVVTLLPLFAGGG
ncbi:MAG: MoaD/ThiS family protein [Candidatus Bathyarchaeota archaeon]|nr:MoaD/ThiS family protein [Candidatus Bathyarchaeota archaeon]